MKNLYRVTMTNPLEEYHIVCERIDEIEKCVAKFTINQIKTIQLLASEDNDKKYIARLIVAEKEANQSAARIPETRAR